METRIGREHFSGNFVQLFYILDAEVSFLQVKFCFPLFAERDNNDLETDSSGSRCSA